MSRIKHKKFIALLAVGLVIAGVASFGAYAYFTSAGSGSGTATAGDVSSVELSSPSVGALYPGGPDVPVTVSVKNPGSGNQHVGTISGAVANKGACQGSWFQIDPITYDTTLDAGATGSASTKVRMVESGTSQDACKSQSLTINWSSN